MLYYKIRANVDPDQNMAGKCASCKTAAEAKRIDTEDNTGPWRNETSMACPKCGAIVYMYPAPVKPVSGGEFYG